MSRRSVGRRKERKEALRKISEGYAGLRGGYLTNWQFVVYFEDVLSKSPQLIVDETSHAYFTAKFETGRGIIKNGWFWWYNE